MFWLSDNWLIEPIIDREYKRYMALAYLRDISQALSGQKFFPYVAHVWSQTRALAQLQHDLQVLRKHRPRELEGLSGIPPQAVYSESVHDDPCMDELNHTLDEIVPLFLDVSRQAQNRLQEAGEHITLEPVGLEPLRKDRGYLFLLSGPTSRIYTYRISALLPGEHPNEVPGLRVKTDFLYEERLSLSCTPESLKMHLLRHHSQWPHPAVYSAYSSTRLPLVESLLPLVKNALVSRAA